MSNLNPGYATTPSPDPVSVLKPSGLAEGPAKAGKDAKPAPAKRNNNKHRK